MDYSSTNYYQMDETEDEEVKRNCYGRKLKYESSCDESDSESESDHEPEDRSVNISSVIVLVATPFLIF